MHEKNGADENNEGSKSLVLYEGGLWEIVKVNWDPDDDLRCGWYTEREPGTTFQLRHRIGPKGPDGAVFVSDAKSKEFHFPNEMEILAIAASEPITPPQPT